MPMRRLSALPKDDPARRREEQRVAAIGREYRAKIDDLGPPVCDAGHGRLGADLELVMPVQRFAVQIRRRKAQRVIHLDWNPLARRLSRRSANSAAAAERPRLVCDDAIHLVTPAGLAPCASCGKPFCRACYRERCPKCGHAVQHLGPAEK